MSLATQSLTLEQVLW